MSAEMSRNQVRRAVTASAICLAALGNALLFAGPELARVHFGLANVGPLASLVGAALLGFGAMNWIARGSILGGIYGRAVVQGNQAHFLVGAIILVKHGLAAGGSNGFWILTCAYILGAALFSYLLFGTGIPKP